MRVRGHEIVLGFLAATAIWAALFAFQPNNQAAQNQPQAATEQKTNNIFETEKADDRLARYTLWLTIFTGVLAISTIGLWIVTWLGAARQSRDMETSISVAKLSAEAADLSAKAAIGMELPVIRTQRVPGLIKVDKPPTPEAPFGGGIYTSDPGRYGVIHVVEFHNYGRTPAFPTRLAAGWSVIDKLPAEPNYFHSVTSSATAIMNPDDDFDAAVRGVVELTDEQLEQIRASKVFLWFYVSLHYRDFLNLPHEARFCWKFKNGFGPGGQPPATYTTHS